MLVVFDVLHARGKDLRALPLSKRKASLAANVTPRTGLQLIEGHEKHGEAMFASIVAQDFEGWSRSDSTHRTRLVDNRAGSRSRTANTHEEKRSSSGDNAPWLRGSSSSGSATAIRALEQWVRAGRHGGVSQSDHSMRQRKG